MNLIKSDFNCINNLQRSVGKMPTKIILLTILLLELLVSGCVPGGPRGEPEDYDFSLSLAVTDGQGMLTEYEEGLACGIENTDCIGYYSNPVNAVFLTATPALGYQFLRWTGDACNNQSSITCTHTFSVTTGSMKEFSVSAEFSKISASGALANATYTYDPYGRRATKTVNGVLTRFIYTPDGLLIAELDANGNAITEHVYVDREPIAQYQYDQSDEPYYVHNDHLGRPLMLTDSSGMIVWRIRTTAFGETIEENGIVEQRLRFPGQYYDVESGLHYNFFRDYDPTTGRYVQSDPIGLDGGINTYAYVQNNPSTYFDFFGLQRRDMARTPRGYTYGSRDYLYRPIGPQARPNRPSDREVARNSETARRLMELLQQNTNNSNIERQQCIQMGLCRPNPPTEQRNHCPVNS